MNVAAQRCEDAGARKDAAVLGRGTAGVEQAEVLRDKSIIEERLKKEQGCYEMFGFSQFQVTPPPLIFLLIMHGLSLLQKMR